jgi:hypothetical protein
MLLWRIIKYLFGRTTISYMNQLAKISIGKLDEHYIIQHHFISLSPESDSYMSEITFPLDKSRIEGYICGLLVGTELDIPIENGVQSAMPLDKEEFQSITDYVKNWSVLGEEN